MKLSEIQAVAEQLAREHPKASHQELVDLMHQMPFDASLFYQELEMDSRYAQFHTSRSHSNSNIQAHSHSFYELICCRNACGAEYLIGTERFRLRTGDIIFIPPDVLHRPLVPEKMTEPYLRDVLWVSDEFMQRIAKHMSPEAAASLRSPVICRTAGTRWEYLCGVFRMGVQETENRSANWQVSVAGCTLSLIAHLQRAITDLSANPLPSEVPELLEQILAYVEENLSQKLNLGEIARHFYVSESTVTQTFRRKMDVSFYRYVTQRRLIAAKVFIERGEPMEVVSSLVGFSDYSSFFRAFKQEYGISPNQFRKLQMTLASSQNAPFI